MTYQVQTSFIESCQLANNRFKSGNFYQAVVNTEDGESYYKEIEAKSYEEASRQANDYAMTLVGNITYVECYPV